jgi:hypothetical protein
MPHPVDAQPRLLQKVIGIRPVRSLQLEKWCDCGLTRSILVRAAAKSSAW